VSDLAILLFMAVALLAWFEGRRVQEIATAYCRRACEAAGVQLLDDVAPVWRLRLVRDADGRLRVQRLYTFEYSRDGERRRGSVVMLGRTPVSLQLEEPGGVRTTTDHFVP